MIATLIALMAVNNAAAAGIMAAHHARNSDSDAEITGADVALGLLAGVVFVGMVFAFCWFVIGPIGE